MRGRWVAVFGWVVFVSSANALGWSTKEHIQLTRIAAAELIADPRTPQEMKEWLAAYGQPRTMAEEREYFLRARVGIVPRGVDGLPFWAAMPDMAIFTDPPDKKVEPYGVHERLLHYIDLEYFKPGAMPATAASTQPALYDAPVSATLPTATAPVHLYRDDLSGKAEIADVPRDRLDPRFARAGMLPFRVEECYEKTVALLRSGRHADEAGQYPRDEHAVKWAGMLAHYAADNTQPHHATEDYKSQSYFPAPRKAPNVHAAMEYLLCDDEENDYPALRKTFWPLFIEALASTRDQVGTDDPWASTLEFAMQSYDALPLIGQAAMHATDEAGRLDIPAFYAFRGNCFGEEMTVAQLKARQLALAVRRIQSLWLAAWSEAAQPR